MSEEFNYSREEPFYVLSLSDTAIKEIDTYLSGVPEDSWQTHQTDYLIHHISQYHYHESL